MVWARGAADVRVAISRRQAMTEFEAEPEPNGDEPEDDNNDDEEDF